MRRFLKNDSETIGRSFADEKPEANIEFITPVDQVSHSRISRPRFICIIAWLWFQRHKLFFFVTDDDAKSLCVFKDIFFLVSVMFEGVALNGALTLS